MINQLKQLLKDELPGESSHQKMIPVGRPLSSLALSESVNYKRSGVAVLLFKKQGELQSVLIERTEFVGNPHSGQVSFPGGTMNQNDLTPEYAARRECCEEISVCIDNDECLGALTPVFIPVSNFRVDAFVFYIGHEPIFVPDKREVATIIPFKISTLMDESIVKSTTMQLIQNNHPSEIPYYDINGYVVWGATAMILSELRELFLRTV